MIKLKSLLKEKYELETYHKSYTDAIAAAKEYAEKKGYEINDDSAFRNIGMGPRKPSEGKTVKVSVELTKLRPLFLPTTVTVLSVDNELDNPGPIFSV
jgi:hypothetical protein